MSYDKDDDLSDAWLTLEALWQGRRDSEQPYRVVGDIRTDEELLDQYNANLQELSRRVDGLLTEFMAAHPGRQDPTVRSGYRPPFYNHAVKGAAHSKHLTGEAVDIADNDNALDHWLDANPQLLDTYNLCREHPSATNSWCHLDTRDPATIGGKRTFYP